MSNISVTATKVNYVKVTPFTVSLPADRVSVYAITSSRCRVEVLGGDTYEVSSSKATVDALVATALTDIQAPPYGAATGTDTYAVTLSPAPTSYAAGQSVLVSFANTNTGAATINLNGLGAKAIKKEVSAALVAGDIQVGKVYELRYDGTNFQLNEVEASDYGVASGTDTYAVVVSPAPTKLITGKPYQVQFGITNTGAATLNINGLGAKAIRKGTGGATALSASDLVITKIYTVIYDGTYYQINL